MKKYALISVSDKTGLEEFAKNLIQLGYTLLSTGGTAKFLEKLPLIEVSSFTQFPEMLGGRVKTLHPKIHAGILAKREEQSNEIRKHGIETIDLVCVNLYPFSEVTKNPECATALAIENIDIGGPTLLRAAAKNHRDVLVISSPKQYASAIENLKKGVSSSFRKSLAVEAFAHTAKYDAGIEKFFRKRFQGEEMETLRLRNMQPFEKYAENWHQEGKMAELEKSGGAGIPRAKKLHGKAMGYNNFLDADAAISVIREFPEKCACAIIKHTNPCGFAVADTLENALERAWQSDSISAFGSIIAFNQPVTKEVFQILTERDNPQGKKGWFVEVIAAPRFTDDALHYIREKPGKKSLRLLEVENFGKSTKHLEYRGITGGLLIQERNDALALDKLASLLEKEREVEGKRVGIVTKRAFDAKADLLQFSIIAAKHIKSNAIAIVRTYKPGCYQLLGMGAGQPNRRDSVVKLALKKAEENLSQEYQMRKGLIKNSLILSETIKDTDLTEEEFVREELGKSILASDAFFPFTDGLQEALDKGIQHVVQPGGSLADESIIQLLNEKSASMCFTGMRHFKH